MVEVGRAARETVPELLGVVRCSPRRSHRSRRRCRIHGEAHREAERTGGSSVDAGAARTPAGRAWPEISERGEWTAQRVGTPLTTDTHPATPAGSQSFSSSSMTCCTSAGSNGLRMYGKP
jgi:hypothetical protein